MVAIDEPKEIREGEELDSAKIEECLKDTIPGLQGPILVQQFPRGRSNLTYLVSFGNRELVLRRPPFGTKAKSAHDMKREYRILSALAGTYSYAPKPLAYSEDTSIIGCPFYVMYCFGLFRLAVIAQQIYYRYYHGQTADDRFKVFVLGVHALEKSVMTNIERSDL